MNDQIRQNDDVLRDFSGKSFRSACYAPFVSLFFTPAGNVLACCRNETFILGNVKQNRLNDIWNGGKITELREALKTYKFDHGCKYCEWELMSGNQKTAFRAFFDPFEVQSEKPQWPAVIDFVGSNSCNFECIMCWGDLSSSIRSHREGLPRYPKVYSDEFFDDLRIFLPHLKWMNFLGGEPFLTSESYRIWQMMAEENLTIPCHVTTNGSQYNSRVERVLETVPIHLTISLDAITKETTERVRINSNFEVLMENFQRFLQYTKRKGTYLKIAFCLMRQNWHEFGAILLFAERYGCEVLLNTVIEPTYCSLFTLPKEELAIIVDKLQRQSDAVLPELHKNQHVWKEAINQLNAATSKSQDETRESVLHSYLSLEDPLVTAPRMIEENRFTDALEELNKLSNDHPDRYFSLALSGYIRSLQGNLEAAEADLQSALKISAKKPEAYLHLARVRLKQNRLEEARQNASRARKLALPEDPAEADACEVLAFTYLRQGNLTETLHSLKRLARLPRMGRDQRVERTSILGIETLKKNVLNEIEADPGKPAARIRKIFLSVLFLLVRIAFKTKLKMKKVFYDLKKDRLRSKEGNESAPLVSIVTAFLNGEKFLAEAIESVLAQTYQNWELILVDDGSTDRSTAIARHFAARYPQKIFYLEHDKHENRGAAASRNAGIRLTKGKYIAILDADDVWFPNKLERQVAILEAEPRAAMVYGSSSYWQSWTKDPQDLHRDYVPDLGIEPEKIYEPPQLFHLLYPIGQGAAPCPSDLLMRRSLFDEIQFQEDFKGMDQLYEDQIFLVRVYLQHPVFVSSECWDQYRIHSDSCMSRVHAAGQHEVVRNRFFKWLEDHLSSSGKKDTAIWGSFQNVVKMNEQNSSKQALPDDRNRRWFLRVAGNNSADLVFPPEDPELVCVVIRQAEGNIPYDIQLNHPRLKADTGSHYRVSFRARAAQPRRATLGFSRAGQPWTNLGLFKELNFTQEWQEFQEDFFASSSEENARIHFDIGGSNVQIELSSLRFLDLKEKSEVLVNRPSLTETVMEKIDKPTVREQELVSVGGAYKTIKAMTPLSLDWGWDRGLPIDRYYIERFLAEYGQDIRGSILEVSDNWYSRKFGTDHITDTEVLDINKDNPKATIIADLQRCDHIPSNRFDCVILPQTLQFVYDTSTAIASLHRILKSGGVLLATLPGGTRTRMDDPAGEWYWSFTSSSAQKLFGQHFKPENVTVKAYGNLVSAISFLKGMAAEELDQQELNTVDPNYQILIGVRATKP